MKADYELTASERWDRNHLYTMGTKLTADKAEAFDAICEAAGLTRYEAIRRFCVAVLMRPETLTGLRWRRAPRKK